MNNKIQDLRNHLFDTIEALLDPKDPMDIERAKAVSEAAQVIINSAKVEVDFLKVTSRSTGTGFFPDGTATVEGKPPAEVGAAPGAVVPTAPAEEPKKLGRKSGPIVGKDGTTLPSDKRTAVPCEHPGDPCKVGCGCVCRPCLDIFLEKA